MQLNRNGGNSSSSDGPLSSSLNGQSSLNDEQFASTITNLPPSSLVETNKSLLASSNMHLIPHVFYEPNPNETSCRYCHVDFSFHRLLRQHIRTMMNNNYTKKPFNCMLCNQGFTTKNVCVRHVEKTHKEISHDQIQNVILENTNLIGLDNSNNKFNGNSFGSELLSNCDSSELDQPLNLANGLNNGLNNLSSDKYMEADDDDFEDNQSALDLSVKPMENNSAIDQLGRSLDLNNSNSNSNNINADLIRNVISTLLALSGTPKQLNESQQLIAQANNLLAAQQLQNNSSPANSLLSNVFNSFM